MKAIGKCRDCGYKIFEGQTVVTHPTNPRFKYHSGCCSRRLHPSGNGHEFFHRSWKMTDHLGNEFVPAKHGMASYRVRRKPGQQTGPERRYVGIKTFLNLKKLGVVRRGSVINYPEGWEGTSIDYFGARSHDLSFIDSKGGKHRTADPDPSGFEYVGAELEVERGDMFKRQLLTKTERSRIFGSVSDGSIDGVEVLTIPSAGPQLIKTMNIVGRALEGMSWKGTDACGAHQHVNFKNRDSNEHIKNAMLVCHKFEPFILERIDEDRVDGDYCRSIRRQWSESGIMATSPDKIDQLYYGMADCGYLKTNKYTSQRYYGSNFHSVWYRGTLEFRYLEGTLDFKKLSSFGLMYAGMVEFVNSMNPKQFMTKWAKWKDEPVEKIIDKRMNTPSIRLLKRFNPGFIQ